MRPSLSAEGNREGSVESQTWKRNGNTGRRRIPGRRTTTGWCLTDAMNDGPGDPTVAVRTEDVDDGTGVEVKVHGERGEGAEAESDGIDEKIDIDVISWGGSVSVPYP